MLGSGEEFVIGHRFIGINIDLVGKPSQESLLIHFQLINNKLLRICPALANSASFGVGSGQVVKKRVRTL